MSESIQDQKDDFQSIGDMRADMDDAADVDADDVRVDMRAHVGAYEWHPIRRTLDLDGLLRPPGAREEAELRRLCDACGACVGACPERAIRLLGPEYTGNQGTPAITPSLVPCRACPDTPCVSACPTGALSLAPGARVPAHTIHFWPDRCWAVFGRACDFCVQACPHDPPALRIAATGVIIDERACTGCGLCIFYCTATPRALTAVAPNDQPASARELAAGIDDLVACCDEQGIDHEQVVACESAHI